MAEWEAYDVLDPISEFRQDYRLAQLCHLIFTIAQSAYGRPGRRVKADIVDFMPWGDGSYRQQEAEEDAQSVDEMKQILLAMAGKGKNK